MKFNAIEKEKELLNESSSFSNDLKEEQLIEEYEESNIEEVYEPKKRKRIPVFKIRSKKKASATSDSLEDEMSHDPHSKVSKVKHKRIKVPRSILEKSPLMGWGGTEEEAFIKYKLGYFEVLQLKSYNLFGMSADEAYGLIESYGDLARLYVPPFKVILMHFPVQTGEQQSYYKELLKQTTIQTHRVILNKKLSEHEFIENNRYDKEYYVMIFGYSLEVLRSNLQEFYNYKGSIKLLDVRKSKKQDIMFQLNNLGAKIFSD